MSLQIRQKLSSLWSNFASMPKVQQAGRMCSTFPVATLTTSVAICYFRASTKEPVMESRYLLVMVLLALGITPSAKAINNHQWSNISNVGAYTLTVSALALPAVRGDWQGFRQAAYSLGTAESLSLGLKSAIKEQRPDNSGNDSFPSGHSALAFASATTLYRRYGWEVGVPAYAVATLTAYARVDARKHHWYDVVAGAAIGAGSGWFFTDAFNNRVQLLPWADSKSVGVLVAMPW